MAKKSADIIKLMEFYGVEFYGEANSKGEVIADCFSCDKEKHLYVNEAKNCYVCHRCGTKGNIKDFFGFLWKNFEVRTTFDSLLELAKTRNVPVEVFKNEKIGYHKGMYIFPVMLNTGDITDLRYYRMGERIHSSPGVITGIYKGENLLNPDNASKTVWICEGEFDCLCLNYLFTKLNLNAYAISVPGANIFKANWAPFFIDKKVVCVYDNDGAGKAGVDKLTKMIKPVCKLFEVVKWPDDYPNKYDISDFLVAYAFKEGKYDKAWELLSQLLVKGGTSEHQVKYDITGKISFKELISHYRKFLDVNDDFETLIKVCIATVLSGKITGSDPVWMFIVGPPGYGKTAALSSFKQADLCYYQSTISRHNLVSGFKTMDGSDPSILGAIGNRCLILKDYTEILSKSRSDREEISGILRGAFDGYVERDFGNGIKRRYETNFPFLAGVTDLIKHHSDAELGERMIRFNLNVESVDYMRQGEQALLSAITGGETKNELQQYVAYYLNQDFDISIEALLERATPEFRRHLIPLAKLIAILRTKVTRHEKGIFREAVSFKPEPESANRLAIQFQRLALALSYLEEDDKITPKTYKLIKRIGFDTVEGYPTSICKLLNKMSRPIGRDTILEAISIPRSSLPFYLEDLELIGIVQKSFETNGMKKIYKYSLSPEMKNLWSQI